MASLLFLSICLGLFNRAFDQEMVRSLCVLFLLLSFPFFSTYGTFLTDIHGMFLPGSCLSKGGSTFDPTENVPLVVSYHLVQNILNVP